MTNRVYMSNKKKKKHIVKAYKNPDDSNEELDIFEEMIFGESVVFHMIWPILSMMFIAVAKDGFYWGFLFNYLTLGICYYLAYTFLFGGFRKSSDKPLGTEKEEPKN